MKLSTTLSNLILKTSSDPWREAVAGNDHLHYKECVSYAEAKPLLV